MHIRSPKFAKVVDPASCLRFQYYNNLVKSKMYHPVNLEFMTYLTYPLLALTADARTKPHLDYAPDFDNSWFKCESKKIKGSVNLGRNSRLLTVVTVNHPRFTLIKV
jgi:hypothetical protein